MKRIFSAVLAALCLFAGLVDAAPRRPRALVLVNSILPDTQAKYNEKYTRECLTAYGFDVVTLHSPHRRPLLWYSSGYGADLGYPNFDAVVLIATSYFWNTSFESVRWDSMSRNPRYNTVPFLYVESRFGFGQVCSTGVDLTNNTGQHIDSNQSQLTGMPGTNYQFIQNFGRGQFVPNSSQSGASVTRLLTAGGDTTYVWRRNAGAGQTFVSTTGQDDIGSQIPLILTGVTQLWKDLPDSVKTKPTFRWGIIMDEGFMRNNVSASIAYSDLFPTWTTHPGRPGIRAYADSIRQREIRLTLSGNFTPDSAEVVEANGKTRIQNEIELWQADTSPLMKWYIHNHAGYDPGALPVGGGNASAVNRRLWDTYGGSRNRECDPNSPSDSSVYALNAAARAYAVSKVGAHKLTMSAGPPSGDYSPRNLLTSTCRLEDLYASLAKAGYNSIIATGNAQTCGHGKVINSSASNGYECAPRTVDTQYGSLKIMYLNPSGGSPLGSDSTNATTQQRKDAFRYNLIHYFVPGLHFSYPGFFSPVLTGHLGTLRGGTSFWIVMRDLDDFFEIQNTIAGYRMYDWAFCDELPATQPWRQ